MDERISPLYITDNESGRKYELDFSRESVKWIESQGYRVEETFDFPNINIPKLFYYAFRKNHKSVSLNQATALLDKIALAGAEKARESASKTLREVRQIIGFRVY